MVIKKKLQAFSLLEVMFAVAIVAMCLGVIFSYVNHLIAIAKKTKEFSKIMTLTHISFSMATPLQKKVKNKEPATFIGSPKNKRCVTLTFDDDNDENNIIENEYGYEEAHKSNVLFILFEKDNKNTKKDGSPE